jgi:hypothetical protein
VLEGLSGKLTVWDVARAETIAVQQPRDHEYRPRLAHARTQTALEALKKNP